MTSRTRIAATALAAVAGTAAVAGCAPSGPSFAPATRPAGAVPDVPALAEAGTVGLPEAAGSLGGVATDGRTLVAAGYLGAPGSSEALLVTSSNGLDWTRVGPRKGFALTDVVYGPGGWVAVGTKGRDEAATDALFLVSDDATSWEPLAREAFGGVNAYVFWVAAGPAGYRAGGFPRDGNAISVSWTSADGRTWSVDAEPTDRAVALPDGRWLEAKGRLVRVRRPDQADVPWIQLPVPAEAGVDTVRSLAATTNGLLFANAGLSRPCGLSTCWRSDDAMGWTSSDGSTWAAVDRGDPGWPADMSELVVAGDGGTVLATHGMDLATSTDGWHWATLITTDGRRSPIANDLVPFGGGVVLVLDSGGPNVDQPVIRPFLPLGG